MTGGERPVRRLLAAAWLWGPPIGWAAVIFLLSSTSNPSLRPPGPDVLLHMGGYALLSLLLSRALAGGMRGRVGAGMALAATLAASLYGVADEIHQAFVPGRFAEVKDVLSDLSGSVLAAAAFFGLARLIPIRTPPAPRVAGGSGSDRSDIGIVSRGAEATALRGGSRRASVDPDGRGSGTNRGSPRVVLYSRKDCHLCHEALRVIEGELRRLFFDLEVRDVDGDPALAREFGSQVPVVFVDGRKAFKHRVDADRLRRLLEAPRRDAAYRSHAPESS